MARSFLIAQTQEEIRMLQQKRYVIARQIKGLHKQDERLEHRIATLKALVQSLCKPDERILTRQHRRAFSQSVRGLIARIFKQDNDWKTIPQLTTMAIALDKQKGIDYEQARLAVYTALSRLYKKGMLDKRKASYLTEWRLKDATSIASKFPCG